MPEFAVSIYIHAPIDRVWAFHEQPDALERLTPPGKKLTVLSRTGGIAAGARVAVRMVLMKIFSTEWHALHTICRKPHLFVDELERGPFAYWHHEHRFERSNAGTVLTDRIEFRLPGGPVLNFFAAPIVRLQLRGLFQYRHAITKKSCE